MARGRIRPASFYGGRVKAKKARAFAGHARRWGMKATCPGELLQVDHMSVSFPGCSVKNFTAACPVTGYLVSRAYSRASATTREEFYATYRMDWRLDTLNRALAQFQHHYCAHRPHGGRGRDLRTPMASYQHLAEAA